MQSSCKYRTSNASCSVRRRLASPPCEKATPCIYVLSKKSPCSLNLTVTIQPVSSLHPITTSALLDSGAIGTFVNRDFIHKHHLETTPLPQPIPVHNVDGTLNKNGTITEEVEVLLWIRSHQERAQLVVTNLGFQSVIIGHSWLLHHNPEVDWANQKITLLWCPLECRGLKLPKPPEAEVDLEPGDRLYGVFIPEEWAAEYIHATTTPSQQLAEQAQADMEQTFVEMVPEAYHDFADVFSKDAFNELPPWKPWDHAIDLTPDADLPL